MHVKPSWDAQCIAVPDPMHQNVPQSISNKGRHIFVMHTLPSELWLVHFIWSPIALTKLRWAPRRERLKLCEKWSKDSTSVRWPRFQSCTALHWCLLMKHDTNIELIGGSILVVMLTIKLDTQVTIGVNEQKPFEVAKSRANGSVHPHHHYHDHHRKGGSRREKERQFPRGQRSSQAATLHYDPTVQLLYFSNCCSGKIF